MTEEQAKAWAAERYPDQVARIADFLDMLRVENERQNLIARSSLEHLWVRHVVDSLQLAGLAPATGTWIDIGTGGGFPGMMIAIVRPEPIMLVEPRQKRAAFLRDSAAKLELANVDVAQARIEAVDREGAVLSARAVAGIDELVRMGVPHSNDETRWLLPRGGITDGDMATLKARFGRAFHVEQSVTSPQSLIVVATGRPT